MAPKIQHKRSAVAGKQPQPGDLEYGEIAVNYEAADPALYIRDTADAIRKIGTQPDATETVKGIAEIATTAEVSAGTDDTRFVTPAKLQAYVTDQLKATWLPGDYIGASDIGTSTWNGPADTLAATGGVEVKIAAGAWGAGGAIAPANQVQVRWIASAVAAAAHAATLTGRVENTSGSVGVDYHVTIDKLPAGDITINAKPDVAAGAVSESDSSTAVHGINAPARLWLGSSDGTTPEVSIAGGAWTAVPATAAAGLAVAAGETFKLRHTTKAGASTVTTTTVRVGWDAGSSVTASYASTNVAAKAPDVGAVTLADVAGGDRFTSVAFPVSATMTDDGTPTSTKKLKAYVEGTLKSAVQTSAITNVWSESAVKIAGGGITANATPTGSDGTSASLDAIVDGSVANAATACDFSKGTSLLMTITPPAPLPGGSLLAMCYVMGNQALTISNNVTWGISEINGSPVSLVSENPYPHPTVAGLVVSKMYLPAGAAVTSFKATLVAPPTLSPGVAGFDDSFSIARLTLTDNTQLTNFAAGDAVTEVTSTGTAGDATGKVDSVDDVAKTITVSASTGTWDVGSAVKGPLKASGANVKLFCKLDAAGAVSDLQSADPGFTAWTPAGTGPYTGTVTFPATLPSGNAPDADLPAGTTVTVEVEASNTSGSDSATSNALVPA